mgnify:CR=1 FL=1
MRQHDDDAVHPMALDVAAGNLEAALAVIAILAMGVVGFPALHKVRQRGLSRTVETDHHEALVAHDLVTSAQQKPIWSWRNRTTSPIAVSTLWTSPKTTTEPVKRSRKPIETDAAFDATSAAIIAVSPGESGRRPIDPPLGTPMSQMVGVQATANVLAGERYKNVSKEIKAYLHGEYGRAPGEINREIQEKILGDEKPVTVRYADLLEPGFEKAKAELGERAKSDEDVLSYIAFPAQAEKFFDNREIREKNTFSYSIEQID